MEKEDFDNVPFDARGGPGRMHGLSGARVDGILSGLKKALAAWPQ